MLATATHDHKRGEDVRARLAVLTAQPRPTFASLVLPVEELAYRLNRVWSPIGHLNAVAFTHRTLTKMSVLTRERR